MTIDETIDNIGVPKNEFEGIGGDSIVSEEVVPVNGISNGFAALRGGIIDVIMTPTGKEDDYINHTLNFMKSEGLGQIIQGITGFVSKYLNVDTLRLAILDVIFGYLKLRRELAGNARNEHVRPTTPA